MSFEIIYRGLLKPFQSRLTVAAICSAGVSAAAVALLGISGWFLAGAAVAGAAGPVVAQAFNYLLPAALVRFLAIARTTLRYAERYLGHSVALNAVAKLRPALFARIATMPPERALTLSRGEAASRFIDDVGELEKALVMRSAPAGALGGLAAGTFFCALASPWAALAFVIVAGSTIAGFYYVGRLSQDEDSQAAVGALKTRFAEIMAILPEVRTCDLREPLLAELDELEIRLSETRINSRDTAAMMQAVLLVATGLGLSFVTFLSLHAGLPALSLAVLSASAGFESFASLARGMSEKPASVSAARRITELFDVIESPNLGAANDLVMAGQRVRIDGPSGSGKTRKLESFIGLRGQFVVPGIIALCPQDAACLNGSVRSNLMIARPESVDLTEDEIWHALDDACLSERVRALPKGLDTWIGEGGVQLSGGERKRLSLARALLSEAPVLALDEPTEGLDPRTERRVVQNLDARLIQTGQGLILISHRPAPRILTDSDWQVVRAS